MSAKLRIGVICLFLAGSMVRAHAQDVPDPPVFQSALAGAREALEGGDIDRLMDATFDLHAVVVRMPEPDSRLLPVIELMPDVIGRLQRSLDHDDLIDYLERLNELAEETERYRNMPAWGVTRNLFDLTMQGGEPRRARNILSDVIGREERLVGSEYSQIRTAKTWLVDAEIAAGDTDEALKLLNELMDVTARLYGRGVAEAAEILTGMARAHVVREEYETAVARANEARDIVRRNPLRHTRLTEQLGHVYRSAGRLADSRDMFALMESLLTGDGADVAVRRLQAQIALSELNAGLGDGLSTLRYLNAAVDLSQNIEFASAAMVRAPVLFLQARMFSHAGLFDDARARLADVEAYAASEGQNADPGFMADLAQHYLIAMAPERAVALAEEVLALTDRDSARYTSASLILAVASSLLDPPVSELALAERLLEEARTENPDGYHFWQRYAVALNLAAEGRLEESATLQRELINTDPARAGRFIPGSLQLRTYAMVLERLGRTDEREEVAALLERDWVQVRASLANQEFGEVVLAETSRFGFEVDLDDAGWQRVRGGNPEVPLAVFSASYSNPQSPNGGSLMIVPVFLPDGIEPPTVIEAFDNRLPADLTRLESWSDGQFDGFQMKITDRGATGLEAMRTIRVVVEPNVVYLLIGGARATDPAAVAAVDAALGRVTITPGVTIDGLSPDESEHHGRVMNYAGNSLFALGQYAHALDFYREAARWLNEDFVASNIANTWRMLADYEQVVATTQQYQARYGADEDVLLWRADAHLNLRNYAEALADYQAGFGMGGTGDDYVVDYVNLLLAYERAEEAAAFLDEYAVRNSSLAVHAMQARTGLELDDEVRLDAALDVLLDPERSEPGAAYVGATIVALREGYGGLLRTSRRLMEDGLGSVELYVLLATRQLQSGRYEDARETIDLGLGVYPGNEEIEALRANLVDQ